MAGYEVLHPPDIWFGKLTPPYNEFLTPMCYSLHKHTATQSILITLTLFVKRVQDLYECNYADDGLQYKASAKKIEYHVSVCSVPLNWLLSFICTL